VIDRARSTAARDGIAVPEIDTENLRLIGSVEKP